MRGRRRGGERRGDERGSAALRIQNEDPAHRRAGMREEEDEDEVEGGGGKERRETHGAANSKRGSTTQEGREKQNEARNPAKQRLGRALEKMHGPSRQSAARATSGPPSGAAG